MDETDARRIEVFEPFSRAHDLTKLILFQPFDLGKWMVIGFAAFLANFAGGGGTGFNPTRFWRGDWKWKMHSTTSDVYQSARGMPGWVLPLVIFGFLFVVGLVLVLLWLGARGRFIFADCVVRNRAAIQEPWREFRREGNSLFVFSLLVALIMIVVLGLAALPLLIPLAINRDLPDGATLVFGVSFLALVAVLVSVGYHLVASFLVPVMYRRRCGAAEGFRAGLAAVSAHPWPTVLYLLFSLVLRIAFLMIGCVLTCVTCCITAIPYIGTVILLPAHVFFMAYLLLFVRQFGPDYDPWANLVAVETGAPTTPTTLPLPEAPPAPPEPPPVQTS